MVRYRDGHNNDRKDGMSSTTPTANNRTDQFCVFFTPMSESFMEITRLTPFSCWLTP